MGPWAVAHWELVDFRSTDGKASGHLRKTGPFTWVETDQANQVRFYFSEIKRHNDAVYLFDPSRYVTLEINLNADKIIYSDTAANRFELYSVTKAYARINGWTINRVGVRIVAGIPAGEYRQTGETTWVELNASQQVIFRFNETQREESSVYLHDPSRNVSLQVDLGSEKVIYSEATRRFDLYSVERGSSDPANVIVTPSLPVKSRNVNTVAFGALNGQPQGYYRQTGSSTWAEVRGLVDLPAGSFS